MSNPTSQAPATSHNTNTVFKRGTVKWFNDKKGFGFIVPADGGKDVFVHHTAINTKGYRSLATDEPVEYIEAKSDKGWVAKQVNRNVL